jgi:hypothetical protein
MGQDGRVRWVVTLAALAALVLANFFLRHTLEHSHQYMFVFFDELFPVAAQKFRTGAYTWSQVFLPNPDLGGSWSTTTLVLTNWLETRLTAPTTWEALNALVVVTSFLTGFVAFRSLVFASTFAIALGFGTHLYQAYATGGPVGLNLLIVYYELLLLCGWRAVVSTRHVRLWQIAFVVVAVVTALAYEGWLDVLVFTWVASPIAAVALWRFGRRSSLARLGFVVGVLTVIGAAHVLIKIKTGYGQVPGAESDVVFNYPALAPAVEDVLSNTLTHFYTVVTNFLPPSFVSSTSLYDLGAYRLVDLQYGYHPQASFLVPMHYLFLWRYYAGAAAAIFAYAFFRVVRKGVVDPSADAIALSIFMLMMIVGGPTHALIKFRPMKAAPILGYQVLVGVIGGALLIAYLLMMARRDVRRPSVSAVIVVASWMFLGYGSLTRPAMFSHLAAQVGLGEGLYPDPWRAAAERFGIETHSASGLVEYRARSLPAPREDESAIGRVEEGVEWLPLLPNALPGWDRWTAAAGVRVQSADGSLDAIGDTTRFQYQLVSPGIAVPPHRRMIVRMRVQVAQGRVCLGVLDKSGTRWALIPDRFAQQYSLDTGTNDLLSFVIANCNVRRTDNDRTRFRVLAITYDLQQ